MSNERAKLLTPEAKEMYSALYCLNLEVVPSIAEDVKAKVLAAVYAERQASRVAALAEAAQAICPYCRPNVHRRVVSSPAKDGQHVLNDDEGYSWTVDCEAAAILSLAEAPTK